MMAHHDYKQKTKLLLKSRGQFLRSIGIVKFQNQKNARFIVFLLIAISIIGPKEYMPLKKVTKIPVLSKESDKHRFPNWKILQSQLTGEIGPWLSYFL